MPPVPTLVAVAGTSSFKTLRWREVDSNFWFRVRCKSGRAIIAGFAWTPPLLDYRRLLSTETTEGGPQASLGTEALSRAEPEVRIYFPPAQSLRTLRPA